MLLPKKNVGVNPKSFVWIDWNKTPAIKVLLDSIGIKLQAIKVLLKSIGIKLQAIKVLLETIGIKLQQ